MGGGGRRPSYLRWFFPLAALLVLAILLLSGLLLSLGRKKPAEEAFLVFAPEGDLGPEMAEQLEKLPGLMRVEPVKVFPAEIFLGDYRLETRIYGVDMEQFPMGISVSSGEVILGGELPLVVGEGDLASFLDEFGNKLTKRQQREVTASLHALAAEVDLGEERETGARAGNVQEAASDREGGGETGVAPGQVRIPAKVLGLAGGETARSYAELSWIRDWERENGPLPGQEGVRLVIRGKESARAVRASLSEAGLSLEELGSAKT